MEMDLHWVQGSENSLYLNQKPFSVEGIWDTMLDELCMIGCRRDPLHSLRYTITTTFHVTVAIGRYAFSLCLEGVVTMFSRVLSTGPVILAW